MDSHLVVTAKYYIVTSNKMFHKSTNLFKINDGTLKDTMNDPYDSYPKAGWQSITLNSSTTAGLVRLRSGSSTSN